MFRRIAWMLNVMVVIWMAGIVGCAGDDSGRSARSDSPYASGVADAGPHGSCH